MPYKLRKAPKKEAYWVVNKQTGKKYSHEPLPHETAMKQLRALYAQENGYKINLKGGASDALKNAIKQVITNLQQKQQYDAQKEKAALDGNMTGGTLFYSGTDEEPLVYLDTSSPKYKKDFWEQTLSIFSGIAKGIFDALGVGGVFNGLVDTITNNIGALGNILGDVFTGNLSNLKNSGEALLVALDATARALPVVGLAYTVGDIINRAIQGKPIGTEDWIELGLQAASAVSGVAGRALGSVARNAGKSTLRAAIGNTGRKAARGAVGRLLTTDNTAPEGETYDDAEQSVLQSVIDEVREELGDGDEETIRAKATAILFRRYLEEHPELPVHSFKSQITGNQRDVLLGRAIEDMFAKENITIPPPPDAQNEHWKERAERDLFYRNFELNKNLDDPDLLKTFYRADYSTVNRDGVRYRVDITREDITPHDAMVKEMIKEDRAFLAEDYQFKAFEYIDSINREDVAALIRQKKFTEVADLVNNNPDVRGYLSNRELPRDNRYDDINIARAQLYKDAEEVIKQQDEEDKERISSFIEEIEPTIETIVPSITDGILQKIADAGGSITREQYDALINTGIAAGDVAFATYATNTLLAAMNSKYAKDGTPLDDDEILKVQEGIVDGLDSSIYDAVFGALIKQTPFKSKEYVTLKNKVDELTIALQEISNETEFIVYSAGVVENTYSPEYYRAEKELKEAQDKLDEFTGKVIGDISTYEPNPKYVKSQKIKSAVDTVNKKYDVIDETAASQYKTQLVQLQEKQAIDYSTSMMEWDTNQMYGNMGNMGELGVYISFGDSEQEKVFTNAQQKAKEDFETNYKKIKKENRAARDREIAATIAAIKENPDVSFPAKTLLQIKQELGIPTTKRRKIRLRKDMEY